MKKNLELDPAASKSLLFKFNIYFCLFSLLPLSILFVVFSQYVVKGEILFSIKQFSELIMLVVCLCLLGFLGVRNSLSKLMKLSQRLKETIFGSMNKDAVLQLAKEEGEVAELAKAFGDVMSRLEENIKELEDTKKTLYNVLNKVGKTLSSVENFDILIQLTLETIVEALGAKRGVVFGYEKDLKILGLKAINGISEKDIPSTFSLGEGTIGWVGKERKPLFIPLLDGRDDSEGDLFAPPLICSPLVSRENLWGVILLSGKKNGGNYHEDELKILSNLANQIAISLENVKLNSDIERTYFETISALALAVEARDPYSRGHSERVAEYSVKMAEKLGLGQDDIKILRDACKLHDVGKIGIADEILKKPGRLSPEEREIIEKHPLVGEGIVRPLKSLSNLIDPIRHHHEKLDGTGYPDGLKQEAISVITRIVTVADIFDALTTDRPYRQGLSYEETFKELDSLVESGKIDGKVLNSLKEALV